MGEQIDRTSTLINTMSKQTEEMSEQIDIMCKQTDRTCEPIDTVSQQTDEMDKQIDGDNRSQGIAGGHIDATAGERNFTKLSHSNRGKKADKNGKKRKREEKTLEI